MKGIVYEIFCNKSGMRYIGSTVQTLEKRIAEHIYLNKSYKSGKAKVCYSFQILDNGGYTVNVLEIVEHEDVSELREREQHYIENLDNVNGIRAHCSKENRQAGGRYRQKVYYQNHSVKVCEQHKEKYKKRTVEATLSLKFVAFALKYINYRQEQPLLTPVL